MHSFPWSGDDCRVEALSLRLPARSSGPLSSPWLLREDYQSEKPSLLGTYSVLALGFAPDRFWQKGSELDLLEIKPRRPPVENAVLKILGEAPISIGRDNLAVLLKKAYVIAGQAALQKAAQGSEEV